MFIAQMSLLAWKTVKLFAIVVAELSGGSFKSQDSLSSSLKPAGTTQKYLPSCG